MKTGKLMRMALLTAVALIIFVVEAQIPVPIAVPGVKLGLSNIVTVYAVFTLGPGPALMILFCRVFLGAVFTGQMMTLMYSLAGGLLCWCSMCLLRKVMTAKQIWICSIFGHVHILIRFLLCFGVRHFPLRTFDQFRFGNGCEGDPMLFPAAENKKLHVFGLCLVY